MDEGKRELEVLVRRREDINAEISRVQDVLEALESFEAPGGERRTASRRRPVTDRAAASRRVPRGRNSFEWQAV